MPRIFVLLRLVPLISVDHEGLWCGGHGEPLDGRAILSGFLDGEFANRAAYCLCVLFCEKFSFLLAQEHNSKHFGGRSNPEFVKAFSGRGTLENCSDSTLVRLLVRSSPLPKHFADVLLAAAGNNGKRVVLEISQAHEVSYFQLGASRLA